MTTKLTVHKVKDTGVELLIRKVSPMLLREFNANHPAPKPPLQEVVIGDPKNGVKELQENETHPDYIRQLEQYNIDFQNALHRFIVQRGVVIELNDEQKAEVEQLRQDWFEENGSELQGSDKYIYVMYIATGTEEDYNELVDAIWHRTQPTQEAVDEAVKSFPDKVSGTPSQ